MDASARCPNGSQEKIQAKINQNHENTRLISIVSKPILIVVVVVVIDVVFIKKKC